MNVGASMQPTDWMRARAAVSQPGRTDGAVIQAQRGARYTGPVVMVTDTHLVQRVGKSSGVVHDLSTLRNGAEIGQAYEGLKPGLAAPRLLVSYEGNRGQAEPQAFKTAELSELRRMAVAWADKTIAEPRARTDFVERLTAFVAELDRGGRHDPFKAPAAKFARGLSSEAPASGTAAEALDRIRHRHDQYLRVRDELSNGLPPTEAPGGRRSSDERLLGATAALWARADASDYKRLGNEQEREQAAAVMSSNGSRKYHEALQTIAPELAQILNTLRDHQVALWKDDGKRRQLNELDPSVIQTRQPQREQLRRVER
jgi:hypothetical protein